MVLSLLSATPPQTFNQPMMVISATWWTGWEGAPRHLRRRPQQSREEKAQVPEVLQLRKKPLRGETSDLDVLLVELLPTKP